MQTVIVMCGYPGCGKTSYAKTELKDFIRYSMDDIVAMLTQTFYIKMSKVYDKVERDVIRELISLKLDIVIDKTHLTQKSRRKIIGKIVNYARNSGLPRPYIKLIVIETPAEICIERNKALRKVPPGIHIKMVKSFEVPTIDEGWDEIIKVKGY